MSLESEFLSVVKHVKDTKENPIELTSNEKLDFYKYYKQAKEGDCNISEPWSINFEAHAKWKAWKSVKGMSKDDAMSAYIMLYDKVK